MAAEGRAIPPGAEGLYRTIMYARNSETKKEEGFWGSCFYYRGSCFYYQDDSVAAREQRLERAVRLMIYELEQSDIYNGDNYDVRNFVTGGWEKP
jgi:hypothetical protein